MAVQRGKIVVCFSEKEFPVWVTYHSTACLTTLDKAVEWIREKVFAYENQ